MSEVPAHQDVDSGNGGQRYVLRIHPLRLGQDPLLYVPLCECGRLFGELDRFAKRLRDRIKDPADPLGCPIQFKLRQVGKDEEG